MNKQKCYSPFRKILLNFSDCRADYRLQRKNQNFHKFSDLHFLKDLRLWAGKLSMKEALLTLLTISREPLHGSMIQGNLK